MARPAPSATTERLYARLPEVYRDVDPAQGAPDYPLLRYLSLVGDQLGELAELIDRVDYRTVDEDGVPGDTSDLADPAVADPEWLPWLAQLVGVPLGPTLDTAARRLAIGSAVGGWQAGTRDAIASAAKTVLTGGKYATTTPDPADPFRIIVTTQAAETPSPAIVLAAVEDARARPAGHELVHSYYAASWALLEADYPTWAAIEAAGSWSTIESNT